MLVIFAILGLSVLAALRLWAPTRARVIRRFFRRVIRTVGTFVSWQPSTPVRKGGNPNRRTRRARQFNREERRLRGRLSSIPGLANFTARQATPTTRLSGPAAESDRRWAARAARRQFSHSVKESRITRKSLRALVRSVLPSTRKSRWDGLRLSCPQAGPAPSRYDWTKCNRAKGRKAQRLEATFKRVGYSGRLLPKSVKVERPETWVSTETQVLSTLLSTRALAPVATQAAIL